MNILYVGHLAIPIRDILTGHNQDEITGWPAYFYPVYKLIEKGHRVDFVVISDLNHFNIKVDWFNENQIVGNLCLSSKKIAKFRILSRLFRRFKNALMFKKMVKKAIKKRKYDFIYCQDVTGFWGNYYANRFRIPCGVRFYGDTFYSHGKSFSKYEYIMNNGLFKFALLNRHIFRLYKMKKSFILTTADGTHGDLTYQLLKPKTKKYDFYFWKTGVDKSINQQDEMVKKKIKGLDYIVYPARIDTVKRQDVAIDVLTEIHSKGYKLHLFLIGQKCNTNFSNLIDDKIKNNKLEEYVHFTGGISQNQMKSYALNSVAAVLTSDMSNRGNVFFELFSIGVPIISFDDGSLSDFIATGRNGFLAKDITEMAEMVIKLSIDKDLRKRVSSCAISDSKKSVLSKEERFSLEVELIEKYASGMTDPKFPKTI